MTEPVRWHPGEGWEPTECHDPNESMCGSRCGCGTWYNENVEENDGLRWFYCPTHQHAAEAFDVLREIQDAPVSDPTMDLRGKTTVRVRLDKTLREKIDALLAAREKGTTEVRSGKTED